MNEEKIYFQSAFEFKKKIDYAEEFARLDLVNCSGCTAVYSWLLAKCPQCRMKKEGKKNGESDLSEM